MYSLGQKRGGRNTSGKSGNNPAFQEQIANGEIPGIPGKDYPVNSIDALKKKGFQGIRLAPAELITPDFPNLPKGTYSFDIN